MVCLFNTAVKVYDFSFHKEPQSTASCLSTTLHHHSLTRLFSLGVLTAPSKNSRMVNSLWTRWALDWSLKGGGNEERKTPHFHFCPFVFCSFAFSASLNLPSLSSQEAELRTATYEVQPRFFPWLVEHGDARATISKLICWQVLYLKLFCIITFKHGDCFSVIASVCSVSIIACVASCVWGTFDTAPAVTIPERQGQKKKKKSCYSHSLRIVYGMCPAAFVRLRMASSLYFPMQNARNGGLIWW